MEVILLEEFLEVIVDETSVDLLGSDEHHIEERLQVECVRGGVSRSRNNFVDGVLRDRFIFCFEEHET